MTRWSATPRRFELIPFDEIRVGGAPSYLVRGLIPRHGLTLVFGPMKSGKTFFMIDLMMHVALDREYRGHRVKGGCVVYCVLEGPHGFRGRIEAFRRHKMAAPIKDVPFHLVAARMSFIADHGELVADIRDALGDDRPPAVIVIDTLRRSLDGSESDDEDIAAYVGAADRVREAFGCAIVIVHHSGLEAGRPRGHTSLGAAVDAQLACTKDRSGKVTVEVQLMRDGPEGETLHGQLREVDIGFDDDGLPMTSCVLDAEQDVATASRRPAEKKLSAKHMLALQALNEAIAAFGRSPPPEMSEIPADVEKVVSKRQWIVQATKRGISDSDRESAPRMAVGRALIELQTAGKIGVWDDYVWPTIPTGAQPTLRRQTCS